MLGGKRREFTATLDLGFELLAGIGIGCLSFFIWSTNFASVLYQIGVILFD